MTNNTRNQKEIYELKQLVTIEKLRAYRRQCVLNDMDKELTALEMLLRRDDN